MEPKSDTFHFFYIPFLIVSIAVHQQLALNFMLI